jgi:serine/threonine-protein kinase Chk2
MDKKDLTIKLMDFGLSKILGHENFTTTLCGTPSYVAPEILTDSIHRQYTRAVDIWSLGVVLYICLCGFPPFSDELYSKENPYSLAEQIKAGRFDYPSPYWDSIGDPALDLIDQMLTVDPEKRYTIDECLEHSWMQNKTTSFSATLDTDDNLFGRLSSLNLSKRKVVRERTLLSSINDVKDIRVIEVAPHMTLVKEHTKNLNSEATISLGGINRTRASADNQIEPPARLFRAPEDLGPQGSSGMSSRSSNVLGLSTDRDKTEVGPGHRGKGVLGGAALGDLEVGDLVDVPGSMHGTVKFIGTVDGKKGIFVGVELSKEFASRGKNSGDVDG